MTKTFCLLPSTYRFGIFLLMVFSLKLAGCKEVTAEPQYAVLTIKEEKRPGPEIKKEIFGSNLQWEWNGDRILVEGRKGIEWLPGVANAIKKAGITSIRFPGGALADTYYWKDAIGDRSKRKDGMSFAKTPAKSTFGSDELMQLSKMTGAEPVMIVNLNITPEDAGDWVDYFNGGQKTRWGKRRAANGQKNPVRAEYWEIGNEIYSPNEVGHTTAKKYGERLLKFAREMRKRDPSIKIGAGLDISFTQASWMASVYPHVMTWNDEVLSVVADEIDFVSLHFYAPFDKKFGDDSLTKLVMAGPIAFEQNLDIIRSQIRKHTKRNIELAITEYNTFFGDTVKLDPRTGTTEAALFNGMMLFSFMRADDVTIANHHSLLNNDIFGMMETLSTGKLKKRSTYNVFASLREFTGTRLLKLNVQSAGVPQTEKGNVPKISHVPYIDAVASKDTDNILRVAMINRSVDQEVFAVLRPESWGVKEFTGYTLASRGGARGEAFDRSNAIVTRNSDKEHILALPPQSLTVLQGRPLK